MGFCVYNNVAVAARHAQHKHGTGKILILDWDVHHGNGTQAAFYEDPTVLFISLHQDDLYPPGWGGASDVGEGIGEGFTVNIPLPAGSGRAAYLSAYERIVKPIAREFSPDFIIVSAGQDASVFDPLGRMGLTTADYRDMTRIMCSLADETCGGRLVVAQEGGYAAAYAPYCSAAIAEAFVLAEGESPVIPEPYGERAMSQPAANVIGLDAAAAIDRALVVQRRYWDL
jgi:acetoin utilization deacetylase AcuC-like enzyme